MLFDTREYEDYFSKYKNRSDDYLDALQDAIIERLEKPTSEEKISLGTSVKNWIRNKFRKSRSKSPRCIPRDKLISISEVEYNISDPPTAQTYLEEREKKHRQSKSLMGLFELKLVSEKELYLLMIINEQITGNSNKDQLEEMQKKFPDLSSACFRKIKERLNKNKKLKVFLTQNVQSK